MKYETDLKKIKEEILKKIKLKITNNN